MKMGKGGKEDGYATTDYSSVQERQKTRKGVQRKEKQDRKDFFCLFFSILASTIKRGTKSHRFPLVLYILLWRAWRRREYRSGLKGGFSETGTEDYKMEFVNKGTFLGTTLKML